MRHLTSTLLLLIFVVLASCRKDDILFNPQVNYQTFTDARDNQTYRSVEIGNQVWMAENLRYNPSTQNNQNEITICEYGRMYTSGNTDYCPEGWHIPSLEEWQILFDHLGGREVASGKLKEAGTEHWEEPNTAATNSSGFTALPAGYANESEGLKERRKRAEFWSSSRNPDVEDNVYGNSYGYISLGYNSNNTGIFYSFDDYDEYYEKRSIRCIKD